jgi:hypothetical protein
MLYYKNPRTGTEFFDGTEYFQKRADGRGGLVVGMMITTIVVKGTHTGIAVPVAYCLNGLCQL